MYMNISNCNSFVFWSVRCALDMNCGILFVQGCLTSWRTPSGCRSTCECSSFENSFSYRAIKIELVTELQTFKSHFQLSTQRNQSVRVFFCWYVRVSILRSFWSYANFFRRYFRNGSQYPLAMDLMLIFFGTFHGR